MVRRLTAIMLTDMAGHTALLQEDDRRPHGPPWIVLVGVALLTTTASMPSPQAAQGVLDRYALDDLDPVRLPRALDEVSGLTFDDRGRLWAHDDEEARIYELDPASGDVLSSFDVGWSINGDWEGLAWAEGSLYLVDSDGVLLAFSPPVGDGRADYRWIGTGLGRYCEIEGLGHEPARRLLLMGCKTPRRPELRDQVVLLSFSLVTGEAETRARVMTPMEDFGAFGLRDDDFRAAAVAVHPASGTILVASARDATIIELSADGMPLGARSVGERALPQLEGLAVAPDGALLLASEAGRGRALLARVPLDPREDP
jgi:hypothetical protein